MLECGMFECKIGRDTFRRLTNGMSSSAAQGPIEYLAITNHCSFYKSSASQHLQSGTPLDWRQMKQILSLKPNVISKQALQIKEEMMERYREDGYYFLEEYVDYMMEMGSYMVLGD
jgi:hypothetical protein